MAYVDTAETAFRPRALFLAHLIMALGVLFYTITPPTSTIHHFWSAFPTIVQISFLAGIDIAISLFFYALFRVFTADSGFGFLLRHLTAFQERRLTFLILTMITLLLFFLILFLTPPSNFVVWLTLNIFLIMALLAAVLAGDRRPPRLYLIGQGVSTALQFVGGAFAAIGRRFRRANKQP